MRTVAVRGKALRDVETRCAAGDEVEHATRRKPAQHLRHDVRGQLRGREAAACPQAHRDRRVQVAARDVPDGEGHREHGQAEGERNAMQADADVRKGGGEHGTAAATEYEPERPKELGAVCLHLLLLLVERAPNVADAARECNAHAQKRSSHPKVACCPECLSHREFLAGPARTSAYVTRPSHLGSCCRRPACTSGDDPDAHVEALRATFATPLRAQTASAGNASGAMAR